VAHSARAPSTAAVHRAQTTRRSAQQHIAPPEVPKHSSVPPKERETHLKRLCSALPSTPLSGHVLQRMRQHFRTRNAEVPLGS